MDSRQINPKSFDIFTRADICSHAGFPQAQVSEVRLSVICIVELISRGIPSRAPSFLPSFLPLPDEFWLKTLTLALLSRSLTLGNLIWKCQEKLFSSVFRAGSCVGFTQVCNLPPEILGEFLCGVSPKIFMK